MNNNMYAPKLVQLWLCHRSKELVIY